MRYNQKQHSAQLFITILWGWCCYHPYFADEEMEAIVTPFTLLQSTHFPWGGSSLLFPSGVGMSAWETPRARMLYWVGRRGRLRWRGQGWGGAKEWHIKPDVRDHRSWLRAWGDGARREVWDSAEGTIGVFVNSRCWQEWACWGISLEPSLQDFTESEDPCLKSLIPEPFWGHLSGFCGALLYLFGIF